jgi:CRP-like cAMP-binding protein
MTEQTELLREIRDLLLLIAEPALAKRDESLRAALLELAGRSKGKRSAILLMDGSRSRAAISKESGIDQGDLSRLVKSLREKGLVGPDDPPKIILALPPKFFETGEK